MTTARLRDVVVIGAGAAGLATARSLQSAGADVCVLESSDRVAASWWRRYEGLRLNTIRTLSDLPLGRMPRRCGRWPDRKDWATYLSRYAEPLHDVVFDITARRLELAGETWLIHTSKGTLHARHVVVATGHDRIPVIPDWRGKHEFAGRIMHSADVRDAGELTGQDILVVGTGNSGIEIATQLAADNANRVAISMRTPPLLLKRQLGPVPITLLAELGRALPDNVIDWMGRALHRRMWRQLAAYGMGETTKRLSLMRHTYYSPPLDSGFAAALQRGSIEIVPAVAGFTQSHVMLAGADPRHFDMVIAATGFRPGLEDLVAGLDVLGDDGEPTTTGGAQNSEAPRLFFAGFNFGLFALLPYVEGDARRITRAITGKIGTGQTMMRPLKIEPLGP